MAHLKVYGMKGSTCTGRVLYTLEELGLPYELIPINLGQGEHKKPEFLALQPFGKVPVLVDEDEGVQIFESRAIIRYLASKKPGLFGSNTKEKALIDNWLEAESQNYNAPVQTIVVEKVFKAWRGAGPADEAVVAAKAEEWGKVLDVYEKILATRQYIGGDSFSIADIAHVPYTHYAVGAGVTEPIESRPNVKAWWERISTRPVWVKLNAPQ